MKIYKVIIACQSIVILLLLMVLSLVTIYKLDKVLVEIKKIEQSTESFAKTVEVYQTLNAPQGYTPQVQ